MHSFPLILHVFVELRVHLIFNLLCALRSELEGIALNPENVHRIYKTTNNGKEWSEQIKPFNFYLIGFQAFEENGKSVKPICPFSKDSQEAVHRPFIDYQSGEMKEGTHYFKRLGKTISQYLAHPEHKFEGNVGLLERKHIVADGLLHVGKEANSVDEQALDVKRSQVFVNKHEVWEEILNMSYSEGERRGINRGTLWRMKKKLNNKIMMSKGIKSLYNY
ncbi:hypothetical protein [Methanogenium organophilum]|uniref:Uncharacterized protein n=1 Tax=Methanogenium organophilum TaxID=2199 RepID=A0A9X9T7R4_METOG|nr:hypothetical protein [Methanogenium organophilum]WAI01359.1 hypothetical protein OU421_00345 [Methanogenium organophilum]